MRVGVWFLYLCLSLIYGTLPSSLRILNCRHKVLHSLLLIFSITSLKTIFLYSSYWVPICISHTFHLLATYWLSINWRLPLLIQTFIPILQVSLSFLSKSYQIILFNFLDLLFFFTLFREDFLILLSLSCPPFWILPFHLVLLKGL